MKQSMVIIETSRDAYGVYDVQTLTVRDLIKELSFYDPNSPVILSFDKGYTFGGITSKAIKPIEDTDYDDSEEDE